MKDGFLREITYLRISVTDLCNLRCKYCMPECGTQKLEHSAILSVEEIGEIVGVSAELGIEKVRITGGEPLVRRGIIEICEVAADTPGICEVCVTTNGTLLKQYASDLKNAGVTRLNISLDSLNAARYADITRTGRLRDALDGIETALQAGFTAIKINAVLIGGVNDDEITDIVRLTQEHSLSVRFIELMPIGECASWPSERFVSAETVLQTVPELYDIGLDGVARLYKLPHGKGTVGLIRPISSHFCPACNRIRVTADGMLKPCLHSDVEYNLRGLTRSELYDTMKNAILQKPRNHNLFEYGASECSRNMNAVGG